MLGASEAQRQALLATLVTGLPWPSTRVAALCELYGLLLPTHPVQLILVHGQIVSLLTAAALSAMFARNPGYDARKLLGGCAGCAVAVMFS